MCGFSSYFCIVIVPVLFLRHKAKSMRTIGVDKDSHIRQSRDPTSILDFHWVGMKKTTTSSTILPPRPG